MKLYHQCGHNSGWNVESYQDDNTGDGLILSPVHMNLSYFSKHMKPEVLKKSFFDPQYYVPDSQKKKLNTYPFFPDNIMDGFASQDFESSAFDSARECVQFQNKNEFEKVIIPARYFEHMVLDYTERQDQFAVRPFLKAVEEIGVQAPIYLTLPLTSHIIDNKEYCTKLLNWVTSYQDIDGIYLIVTPESESDKQIKSENALLDILKFLHEVKIADLEVIIGYCNTEGLLYTLVDGCEFSFGTFENTRKFSVDKFFEKEDKAINGPVPRIYLPKLLNWIRFPHATLLRKNKTELWKNIYEQTDYAEEAFSKVKPPHFSQPELYKHHLKVFSKQVSQLSGKTVPERFKLLSEWIQEANRLYAEIGKSVPLEQHSTGDHLLGWETAITFFYNEFLS